MDDELLEVKQVLLLENLTYMADKGVMKSLAKIQEDNIGEVLTVRDIIGEIKIDQLDENIDYSTFQNGEDWRKVLNAILVDDTLPDMTMIAAKEGSEETGGTAKKQIRVGKERLGEKENKSNSYYIVCAACDRNCGHRIPYPCIYRRFKTEIL